MADETNTATSEPREFKTDYEECYVRGGAEPAAALLFNPDAQLHAVAAAALSRAECLLTSVRLWSEVPSGHACASEVAGVLWPLAEEVHLILSELCERMGPAKDATP